MSTKIIYTKEHKQQKKFDSLKLQSEFQHRWHKVCKNRNFFVEKNSLLLQGIFPLPRVSVHQGWPQKSFDNCSKRNKTKEHSEADLVIYSCATQSQLNAFKVIKKITRAPHLAAKCKQNSVIQWSSDNLYETLQCSSIINVCSSKSF